MKSMQDTIQWAQSRYLHFHNNCDDCGVDTLPLGRSALHEFYMIHDKLWQTARRWPKNGTSKLERKATLCIGCLEARLGRRLAPADFQRVWKGSRRLMSRALAPGDGRD